MEKIGKNQEKRPEWTRIRNHILPMLYLCIVAETQRTGPEVRRLARSPKVQGPEYFYTFIFSMTRYILKKTTTSFSNIYGKYFAYPVIEETVELVKREEAV